MDSPNAEMLAARQHLQAHGWIGRRSEAFRHLPPPALEHWLQDAAPAPAATADWTVEALGDTQAASYEARWLDATDTAERAELLGDLPPPGNEEGAPFAWAHRALCRGGLRVRVPAAGAPVTPWLQLRHRPATAVGAPLLVLDIAAGARCVLVETHEHAPGTPQRVQNLQVHVRLGRGARLQHLRIVAPGATDDVAHHVHAVLDEGARYAQALVATGGNYHLQRCTTRLQGADAEARHCGLLLAGRRAIDHQVYSNLQASGTRSDVEMLALAGTGARAVANAYTRIAPGSDDADVHQLLKGIALEGNPRLVLRPHLEILHDQVQAVHGATWGALPEDALFYARQRGLDEATARSLIIEGMAHAVLERCLDEPGQPTEQPSLLMQWLDGGWLAAGIMRHLHLDQEPAHE